MLDSVAIVVTVTVLVLLAYIVQETIEFLKRAFPLLNVINEIIKKWVQIFVLMSFALGLLIAYGANLDLFELMNIPVELPYVGMILAATIIGAGSNKAYEILKGARERRNINLDETTDEELFKPPEDTINLLG